MSIEDFRTAPSLASARTLVDEHAREVLAWALPRWSDLSPEDRERFARAVPTAIGRGTFLEIVEMSQGDLTHAVARYDVDAREMVLIPGGEVTLGWERAPLDSLQETWEQVRAQVDRPHGIQVVLSALEGSETEQLPFAPKQLHAWLDEKLSAHRTVTLAPYLIEAVAAQVPWSDIDASQHDEIWALDASLRAKGQRLATPDEWEHAASGGSRALFRWGNYWPNDVDTYCATEGEAFRPNAFGLTISVDPYWPEVVSDGGQMRGGDGGEMVCGGAPAFASWLTQMPGFIYDLRYLDYRDICLQQSLYRAVIGIVEPDVELVEWQAPDPRTDLRAAQMMLGRLAQRYGGLRARPGEIDGLRQQIPLVREIGEAHDEPQILVVVSDLLRRAQLDDEAVAVARRAVELERHIATFGTLGLALRCAGKIDEAVGAFEEAHGLQPSNPNPLLDIADMLAEVDRVEEAIGWYDKALEVDASNVYAVVTVAYWKATRGDGEAKKVLEAHIDKHPRDQYVRSLLEKLG